MIIRSKKKQICLTYGFPLVRSCLSTMTLAMSTCLPNPKTCMFAMDEMNNCSGVFPFADQMAALGKHLLDLTA
jgi:hypothetical protein